MADSIRAVILDDEQNCIDVVEAILLQHYPMVDIVGQFTDPLKAIPFIQTQPVDLLFIDINMPVLNGFEVLDRLMPFTFRLIFTTAYDSYAIRALRYGAIDYLLKPIAAEDMLQTMQRFLEDRRKSEASVRMTSADTPRKIAISNSDGMIIQPVREILFCEADNSYTIFHLTNGKKFVASKTLKDFEPLLQGLGFFRIHNSYLVNLEHIQLYTKSDGGQIRIQDQLLPVSRTRKEEFLVALERFLNPKIS
jgi:two-component system LytT family response regulator